MVKLTRQKDMLVESIEFEFLQNVRPVHSNIVRYFDVTDEYIFMEQCPLGSLDRYLGPAINLPVVEWTLQLCDALVYIHSLGWAHNQLRPSNILVANHGAQLKICDFSRVTAITSNSDGTLGGRGDVLDVFSLGVIVWFMQLGGKSVPDHLWDCDNMSEEVQSLRNDGLQLTRVMDLCWSRGDVRPSAVTLRSLLRELLEDSGSFLSQTDSPPKGTDKGSHCKPPTDEKLARDVGSFPASSSNVRLAAVKFPRDFKLDDPDQEYPLRLSFFGFHLEHTFLRSIKPVHPNIVHYLAVTDNCIYTKLYLSSLESYLTPDIKPPVFEWTSQLCSALAYLHGLGFAHCDVRPNNILVGSGGSEILLGDFGTVTRAHMPCEIVDEHSPQECSLTVHQTLADLQEHPADAADVYSLGLIVWFMQNGGKAIPANNIWVWKNDWDYLDAIHSHLDIVDFTGLQLAEFMQACWAPRASRPTSRELLDRLTTHCTIEDLSRPDLEE